RPLSPLPLFPFLKNAPTTETSPLSLHDALPISEGNDLALIVQKFGGSSVADSDRIRRCAQRVYDARRAGNDVVVVVSAMGKTTRSEEHTSELQSLTNLVCRLLLEKKKIYQPSHR